MGKIVMPKNSALLDEVLSVLKIYYEADGWLDNATYKDKLKLLIGDDQYSSSYTKKAQITSYFGFTTWEDIHNAQSKRKITQSGIEMYDALRNENHEKTQELLMRSLETVVFGRNNYGCPDSDSDVEPPSLFIRAILDLDYLTYKEFAYLLWKLEDIGKNYTDAIKEIRGFRNGIEFELGDDAKKYTDCKPIMVLVRWGFLQDIDGDGGSKHIIIAPEVFNKYKHRLRSLKIYNVDKNICENEQVFTKDERYSGTNTLYYGVPGSGKSNTVDKMTAGKPSKRVVFHPDYTNSDFVGQILPGLDKHDHLEYRFNPGPFTDILLSALKNRSVHHYLIVEEINRGNAPAIFGEVFQLLDRDDKGSSKYGITNDEVLKYLNAKLKEAGKAEIADIKIPGNLSLLATMNTSDQNVFTIDTAFQRRWNMKYVKNNFDENVDANENIAGSKITWKVFGEIVNDVLADAFTGIGSAEDKGLGAFFAKKEEITDAEKFGEKVLKYLWDDAFKMDREAFFNIGEGRKKLQHFLEVFEKPTVVNGVPVDSLELVIKPEVFKNMLDKLNVS